LANFKKEHLNFPMVTVDKWIKKNEESEGPPLKLQGITNAQLKAAANPMDHKEA
jgi:hypothetical protein